MEIKMDMKDKYGFLFNDELTYVGRIAEEEYELLPRRHSRLTAPMWAWTTKSPTTLIHMVLKPRDFKGVLPTHPKVGILGKPVVIITTQDNNSLYIEYRQACMPMLLPTEGEMIDTATLEGKDSNRMVHIFRYPSVLIGPSYCTPMEIGKTYFNIVGGESRVYECVGYQSKDECILIELDDEEVAVGLAEGGPCTKRAVWVGPSEMDDQEYLTCMPGMVDSIVDGIQMDLTECSSDLHW